MRGGLKVLSGEEVADILAKFGFTIRGRNSTHMKLRRSGIDGNETLIVPDHAPVARGTLRAIFKQASRYVPQSDLRRHFYND
jgi:predicted RNA binding protein YcfA (HicA-like mRNA interferase family)